MFLDNCTRRRLMPLLLAALLLGGLAGCGGPRLYPVAGRLVWEDGSPAKELAGGRPSSSVTARMGCPSASALTPSRYASNHSAAGAAPAPARSANTAPATRQARRRAARRARGPPTVTALAVAMRYR